MTELERIEHEIKLACQKENPDWDGTSFDYGCSIYQSCLKGIKAMIEDGHSGMSWGFAITIMNRLMRGLPLSSITEDDFIITNNTIQEEPEELEKLGLKSSIQCPRMTSLSRNETLDGKVTYSDMNRCYCINEEDDTTFTTGTVTRLLDEIYPIRMPYYPSINKYRVHMIDINLSEDISITKILYIETPNNGIDIINRYFIDIPTGVFEEYDIEGTQGNIHHVKHPKYKEVELSSNEVDDIRWAVRDNKEIDWTKYLDR